MLRNLLGQSPEQRPQALRLLTRHLHELIAKEIAGHRQLGIEKIRREWWIDVQRRTLLERHQHLDRLAVQPHSLLAILVQNVEERAVAYILLQRGGVSVVEQLGN